MFTFSLPKIIILGIIVFVIYTWAKRNAVQSDNRQGGSRSSGNQPGGARQSGGRSANPQQKSVEDLVKCPSCGTYMAAGSTCGCGQGRP